MNFSLYTSSSKEENSPLGWATVRKKIKEVSDNEFLDHFKRFYESENSSSSRAPSVIQRPGLLGNLSPAVTGSSILVESKAALLKIAVLSVVIVGAFWWVKTQI